MNIVDFEQNLSRDELDILILIYILEIHQNLFSVESLKSLKNRIESSTGESEDIANQLWQWIEIHESFEAIYISILNKFKLSSQKRSNNSVDLMGLGSIVGHVKDFLIRMIEIRENRGKVELENEALALDNQKKKLENISILLQIAKESGRSYEEIRILMASSAPSDSGIIELIRTRDKVLLSDNKTQT